MPFSFDDPVIQSSILPLGLALLLTLLLRFSMGPVAGRRLACLAPGISFLILILLVQGFVFPPVASTHKFSWLVAALLLLSAAADGKNLSLTAQRILFVIGLAAALWWLNQTRWARADNQLLISIAAVYAVGLLLHWRLSQLRKRGLLPVLIPMFAAGASAAITLLGASALLATLGFVMMASLGGFALCNWPQHRYPAGAGISIGIAGALTLLLNQVILLTDAAPVPLLMLLPLLFVNRLSNPLISRWQLRDTGQPLIVSLFCLLIVALALSVAWYLNPMDSDTGY